MKNKIILIALLLPLLSFSALSDADYNVSYEIDSLRNLTIQTTIFLSSSDLVFLRENDSLYKGEFSVSVTMLRKDKSPIKSFFSDSLLYFNNYQRTKEDSVINIFLNFPSDSMMEFISIELSDKNSSNKFNAVVESNAPKISKNGSYILSANFLNENDYFANDSIKLAVKSIITDTAEYAINFIVQNSEKKVIFKQKFKKSATEEDTIAFFKDLYGGMYKVTLELIRNNKKLSSLYKEFSVKFSFINSEKEFSDLLSALSFIGKWNEIEKIRKAENTEREILWNDFWFKQQYHPEISSNVSYEEFLERYNYANKNFSGFKKGFLTDFGRIYIMYGKPDEIERHLFDNDSKPFEIWYYWSFGYEFLFVDERGYGDYTLNNYMEQLK
jgi:GWxTD domain-containing protein